MHVTIEVKQFLSKLQEYNPSIDLTGVKAYLLDLSLGMPVVGLQAVPTGPIPRSTYPKVPEKAPLREPEPTQFPNGVDEATGFVIADDITAADLANMATPELSSDAAFGFEEEDGEAPPPTAPYTPPGSRPSPAERKNLREGKRKGLKDYTSMSSKEIMEQLTEDMMVKKKSGQNQFVDMGAGGGSGGDIEIG